MIEYISVKVLNAAKANELIDAKRHFQMESNLEEGDVMHMIKDEISMNFIKLHPQVFKLINIKEEIELKQDKTSHPKFNKMLKKTTKYKSK